MNALGIRLGNDEKTVKVLFQDSVTIFQDDS